MDPVVLVLAQVGAIQTRVVQFAVKSFMWQFSLETVDRLNRYKTTDTGVVADGSSHIVLHRQTKGCRMQNQAAVRVLIVLLFKIKALLFRVKPLLT